MTARSADGVEWTVTARSRTIGPAIPYRLSASALQEFSDGRVGTSALTMRARVRPAIVEVTVHSEGNLDEWLTSGRHLGAVIESAEFTLGEPRFK